MNDIFGIILMFNDVVFHLFDVGYLLTLLGLNGSVASWYPYSLT